MTSISRKTLLAGAVMALAAVPAWAAGDSYSGTQSQTRSQMRAGGQVQTMTPSQLRGTEVVGAGGEQIGSVKAVVRSRQDKNIHAVISAGGFLGVGDKEITVPLDRMSYEGGKLRLSATEDELKARPAYRAEQYVELEPKDQPISEFSAFETVPDKDKPTMRSRSAPTPGKTDAPYQAYPETDRVAP